MRVPAYVLEDYSALEETIVANLQTKQVLVKEALKNIFNQITRE